MPSIPCFQSCKVWFFLTFSIISAYSYSQTDSTAIEKQFSNAVSFNIAGTNILYSVNYSNYLKENGWGSLVSDLRLSYSSWYKAINYSIQEYFGKKNHHLVVGLGYTLINNDNPDLKSETTAAPTFDLGYCYRNPNKRFTYGIYLQPYYDGKRYNQWGGVTLGYNFNNKITILPNKLFNKDDKQFSIYIGTETSVGKGHLSLDYFGKNALITLTNSAFIKYYLKKLYLKGTFGYYTLKDNTVEKDGSQFEVLRSNASFSFYSFGIGIPFINTNGWYLSPEVQAGSFHSQHKLTIKPVQVPFDNNSDLNYDFSSTSSNQITPYFFKTGISVTKSLYSFLDINAACYYSNNCLLVGNILSEVKLKSSEYQIVLGLQFHIL